MAETTLSESWTTISRRVAEKIGYHPSSANWSESEAADIADILRQGYLRALYPPAQKKPPKYEGQPEQMDKSGYTWSFLKPSNTLALSSGTSTYDLPDNFGGDLSQMTLSSGGTLPVALRKVEPQILTQIRASEGAANGTPVYFTIRAKTPTTTSGATANLTSAGQRFEVELYPTPGSTMTATYYYSILVNALSATNLYPLGGAVFANLVLTACLVVAEEWMGEPGAVASAWQQSLVSAIALDEARMADVVSPWKVATVTYGTYDWLQQEIGLVLGFGASASSWSHDQYQRANSIIQRGYQLFLMPVITGISRQPHRWSFLRPTTSMLLVAAYSTGTITVVDGVVTLSGGTFPSWAASGDLCVAGVSYSVVSRDSGTGLTLDDLTLDVATGTSYSLQQTVYDLPSDFGGIDGPMTYQNGTSVLNPAIELVSERKLATIAQQWSTVGQPRYGAIRPKTPNTTNGTQWEIELWPASDAAYTVYYRFKALQAATLSAGKYPMGGVPHAETILSACLSVIDPARGEDFQRKLASSIALDQAEFGAETVGFNCERTEGEPSYRRNSDLVRFDGVLYD